MLRDSIIQSLIDRTFELKCPEMRLCITPEYKTEVFEGCYIEKKSLTSLLKELEETGKKICIMNLHGENIRDIDSLDNCVFVSSASVKEERIFLVVLFEITSAIFSVLGSSRSIKIELFTIFYYDFMVYKESEVF